MNTAPMAPSATPSGCLPKSKSYAANAPTASPQHPPAASSAEQPQPAPRRDADFTHPEHVIPARSYQGVENLVVVCCHAIFHPDASSPDLPLHSPADENNWLLAPFQKSNAETGKPGEQETFIAHALAGLDVLPTETHAHETTLLVLSGGPTKSSITPLSEARSYYNALLALELAQGNRGGGRALHFFSKGSLLLEEHATDSFQNLLFSILLFRRTTGIYPKQIRIITHAFKAKRFLDLHATAIKWPADRIQVQGIDPVMSSAERDETIKGEETYGYAPWLKDPLGAAEPLAGKRRVRGWNEGVAGQLTEGLEESVHGLVTGVGSDQLPWTSDDLVVESKES